MRRPIVLRPLRVVKPAADVGVSAHSKAVSGVSASITGFAPPRVRAPPEGWPHPVRRLAVRVCRPRTAPRYTGLPAPHGASLHGFAGPARRLVARVCRSFARHLVTRVCRSFAERISRPPTAPITASCHACDVGHSAPPTASAPTRGLCFGRQPTVAPADNPPLRPPTTHRRRLCAPCRLTTIARPGFPVPPFPIPRPGIWESGFHDRGSFAADIASFDP
jgi:hypothetical protein